MVSDFKKPSMDSSSCATRDSLLVTLTRPSQDALRSKDTPRAEKMLCIGTVLVGLVEKNPANQVQVLFCHLLCPVATALKVQLREIVVVIAPN